MFDGWIPHRDVALTRLVFVADQWWFVASLLTSRVTDDGGDQLDLHAYRGETQFSKDVLLLGMTTQYTYFHRSSFFPVQWVHMYLSRSLWTA